MTQSKKNTRLKPKPQLPAYEPAPITQPVTTAIQAVYEGRASEHQQKTAIKWIINNASLAHEPPYRPGADGRRDTDFALGRAFVGQQILGLLKINLLSIQENES